MEKGLPIGKVTLGRKDGSTSKGGPYQSRVEMTQAEMQEVRNVLRVSGLHQDTLGKMLSLLGEELEYRVTLTLFTKAHSERDAAEHMQKLLHGHQVKVHEVRPV